jgi:hypothetical protein
MVVWRRSTPTWGLLVMLVLAACAGPGTVPGVRDVRIDDGGRTVAVGATLALSATVTTVGGASDAVTWSSGDDGVATVSTTGEVTGAAVGTAMVTATSAFDARVFDSVLVSVLARPAVEDVTIDESELTLTVGSTVDLRVSVVAVGGADAGVVWSTSDADVAGVNASGRVTAIAAGVARIDAVSVFDDSKRASATVTVAAASQEPGVPATISVVAGDGQAATVGSAVPAPPSVRVLDAAANPLPNVAVTFAVTAGGGSVTPDTPVTTDAGGVASLSSWVLGTTAGSNAARATVTDSPTITTAMRADGTAGAPSALTSTVAADATTLLADGASTSRVTVQLKDAFGNDVASGDAAVTFGALDLGTIEPVATHLGGGRYAATYTAGTTAGTVTVRPSVGGVAFSASVGLTLMPVAAGTGRLDVVAEQAVAAGEVVLAHASGATLETVVTLRPGVIVRATRQGTTTRLAWAAMTAASGPQVQLTWDLPLGAPEPTLVRVSAYAGDGTADLGAAVVLRVADGPAAGAAPPAALTLRHPDRPELEASYAQHPLGDVTRSGLVDVRDALAIIEAIRASSADPFVLYHSDLDADDVTDLDDVRLILDKIVDPTLPAALHVKPRHLTYVQLDPDTDQTATLLVANRGSLPLTTLDVRPPPGITATEAGGIPGQSRASTLALARPRPAAWLPATLTVISGTQAAEVRLGSLVLLVAGQSNASGRGLPMLTDPGNEHVRMLGNDYRWRIAQEPLDAATNQRDGVSRDTRAAYSFGTMLGHLLHDALGHPTYLIPTALGGSSALAWLPAADPLDRTTLYGSANYRAHVSRGSHPNPASQPYPHEGGPVNAIIWYQGESEAGATARNAFVNRTNQVFNAFHTHHGAPTIYVQLASEYAEQHNLRYHAIAELQRRMETGSGEQEARSNAFMVVAHDLPRSDSRHLSAFAHRILAHRIDLAIRQHVFGEAVDGTGPRLTGIRYQGDRVFLSTTHALSDEALDTAYFTIYDGAPTGSLDDVENYGDNAIGVTSAQRDPTDPTTIRITLARTPAATPHVRYMTPPGWSSSRDPRDTDLDPPVDDAVAAGVIRAATTGLPLPTFGPRAARP